MLTVTYTGNNYTNIYLDGVLFESNSSNPFYWQNFCTNTFIGGSSSTANINYKLDNIRTYDRVLTAAEIQAIFNAKQ